MLKGGIKSDDLLACYLDGTCARQIIPNFALNRATRFTASIYFHTKYRVLVKWRFTKLAGAEIARPLNRILAGIAVDIYYIRFH